LSGSAGYFWFGNHRLPSAAFHCPLSSIGTRRDFTRKNLNLDLRYYDTNLSKESCSSSPAIPTPRRAAAPILLPILMDWFRAGATPRLSRSSGLH